MRPLIIVAAMMAIWLTYTATAPRGEPEPTETALYDPWAEHLIFEVTKWPPSAIKN